MTARIALGTIAVAALALLLRFGDVAEESGSFDEPAGSQGPAASVEQPGDERASESSRTIPPESEARIESDSPAAIGFAFGVPTDTTGTLLPRDYPADDPALVSRYYLYLPRGLDTSREWPMILYLHGRSLRGTNLTMLTRYGLPARLEDDDSFPFIVVAPQLPGGESWTDTDRLARLVEETASRYPVDRSRIYLIGYSMGAGGVWRLAVDYPSLFAAAAPAAAWTPEPSPAIAGALRELPIRIDHGTADEVAPYARARTMAEALEDAGVELTFETYEGADHGELTRIYEQDDLYAWLLSHRRDRLVR